MVAPIRPLTPPVLPFTVVMVFTESQIYPIRREVGYLVLHVAAESAEHAARRAKESTVIPRNVPSNVLVVFAGEHTNLFGDTRAPVRL